MSTHPSKDYSQIAPCISNSVSASPVEIVSIHPSAADSATQCVHLSQRHTRGREVCIVLDCVGQLGRRFPGHTAGFVGGERPEGLCRGGVWRSCVRCVTAAVMGRVAAVSDWESSGKERGEEWTNSTGGRGALREGRLNRLA